MKKILFLAVALAAAAVNAQELFPNSEPASIVPKNALGIRLMNEAYSADSRIKSWHGAMFMYGLSSKLMLNGMVTTSNHHGNQLPSDYIKTDAEGNKYVTQNNTTSAYLFESVNLGFRFRFLNRDGDHKHFRMAFYANGVFTRRPHDESEVTLMGDNKGIGGGVISTVLIKKLAVSFTGGVVKPFSYRERNTGISLQYGNAFNYSLSFGYLLFPLKYKSFNQTNINLYAEFMGKTYDAMNISQEDNKVVAEDDAYKRGNYVEFRPAVQFIIKSNLRIDCSTALPLVSKSYIRKYPLYLFNVQYYFFL